MKNVIAPRDKQRANAEDGTPCFGKAAAVLLILAAGGYLSPILGAPAPPALRFQFGSGKAAVGFVQVPSGAAYAAERGYGFDFHSPVRALDGGGDVPLHSGYCTSDQPFYFSVALPEGNYDVTVTLGNSVSETTTTVKAECRRLMLENIRTAAGHFTSRTFTANLRTPKIAGDRGVKLKPRELGPPLVLHWDDKLTLEFSGTRPALCALEIAPATNAITVFLLGDSTVTDQPREPWNSWGQMLTRFFKPGVAVANHAESGESIKSSMSARRVEKVLTSLKPGDYVFVQFGHNDQKDRATNALATYKTNLKTLVASVRARGATPVLVTSMERMGGVQKDTLGEYPEIVRQVASAEDLALIDLHAMSRTFYRALGPNLKQAFQDGTHHNAYGSYELAKCVVEGIKVDKLPLAKFLSEDVPSFEPSHPDPVDGFAVPPSPQSSAPKPEGN